MYDILAKVLVYFLSGATVFMTVALFLSIMKENDKEKSTLYFKPEPIYKIDCGLSKRELNKITRQVLKNDRKNRYKVVWR